MKKIMKLCFIFLILLVLTGCGSDIKCSRTYDDNVKYKISVTANVSDGKVTNAKAIMKFVLSKDANDVCNLNKLINNEKISIICNDKTVIINGYEFLQTGNETSKNDFIKNLESQGFKC